MRLARKTRKQRYLEKLPYSTIHDVCLAAPSLTHDSNVAFLLRIAACYGLKSVDVIGSVPPYRELRAKSGTTNIYVPLNTYSTEEEFLEAHKNRLIFSCELTEDSQNVEDFEFPTDCPITIFTGHETLGVPGVIQNRSIPLHIPMRGPGVCLNTTLAANIVVYELIKQINKI